MGQTKVFQVGGVRVRVRSAPGLSGERVGWLMPGESIAVDADSRTEVDGYVWWRHEAGWSAEKSTSGAQTFLSEPVSAPEESAPPKPEAQQPGTPVSGVSFMSDGLPNVDTLPLRNSLFKRLPIDLDQIYFWQYYGNNKFAADLLRQGKTWYRYAQGLHAGLDFGNPHTPGVPVYAGIEGTFDSHRTQAYKPNDLRVQVGDYLVIYGHLTNPRSFQVGQPIGPGTVMGEIEVGHAGAAEHLHLEVRYQGKWIINPLLMMPEEMRNAILAKFPPSDAYFYRQGQWSQWQTPLDQPVLVLSGKVLSPYT